MGIGRVSEWVGVYTLIYFEMCGKRSCIKYHVSSLQKKTLSAFFLKKKLGNRAQSSQINKLNHTSQISLGHDMMSPQSVFFFDLNTENIR